MRVGVIGGGPAGLLAARLLALDGHAVTLFERLPPDDTFGFGVGLTGGLLKTLEASDRPLHDAIVAASFPFAGAAFRLPAGEVELSQFHTGAIGRAKLLRVLTEHAQAAGVDVRIGDTVTFGQLDHDLVIAADGVGSSTREALASVLGVSDTEGRGLFVWCGAPVELEGAMFRPVRTEHGLFVAHAYPYAPGMSTFVIETDAAALAAAGCRQDAFAGEADSDERALAYLSDAFADTLGGRAFVGNKSRWMHFRTIACETWHHENVVLLGDAKATAHPSMGSGTKLALEDAVALAQTLREGGDLAAFEAARRPAVETIQDRARRSQLWWESFGSRLHLSPARVAVAYLSRAGAVSLDQLAASAPELARRAVTEWAGTPPNGGSLAEWVLDQPGRRADPSVNGTEAPVLDVALEDPWSPEADGLLGEARALAENGASYVQLAGDPSRPRLLDRIAFGERVRMEVGVPVAVISAPDQLGDVADGIVAGRVDLAVVRP